MMETTKKELQKEIDKCNNDEITFFDFYHNVKDIVARMPDDVPTKYIHVTKSETKPEPSLLEVAMHFALHIEGPSIKDCFDRAEKFIAENERRKNGKY